MKHLQSLLLCVCVLLWNQGFAQTPYQFNWKQDATFFILGGVTSGLAFYYRSNLPILSTSELEALNVNDINAFDRLATHYYSQSAGKASDYFWLSTHTLPFLFLAGKESRSDFSAIATLYGEVFLINTGITALTKNTFRRTRPFVYNPNAPLNKKLTKTARSSFVSGHTSITAANCFFVAKVFSDYYPESNWRPAVWTSAALIPAITGYLRIRAGKHYPTDTIAGYILGATIGYLIPHLHKKKMEKLSFYGGLNGVLVQVRF